MKRLTFSLVSVLLLAACGANSASITYDLTMDVTDVKQRQELAEQSLRVIERRLDRMGEVLTDKKATVEGDTAQVMIAVEHPEALTQLTAELQKPFDLRIMAQADEGQPADVTVEGHGGFIATGVTGDDLDWVQGREVSENGTGEVRLVFTIEGRAKMADLFRRMKGKNIGLFVRDQLVSKLQVDTDELKDDIVIREIPTAELAIIFADDVNVGTHVTFTPVP